MSCIKKVILKLKRIVLYFVKQTSKKRTLLRNSVIINRASWELFDEHKFDNTKFDLVLVDGLYEIKNTSYDKIVAYIGGNIDKSNLKKLPHLKWLQIPSHGFNGFDAKSIYAKDDVVVTNMHGVFSSPMANFCITAWYVFHCPAFHGMIAREKWICNDPPVGESVSVMIYGLGDIGNEIAKACHRLSWQVYGVKRTIPDIIPDYINNIISFKDSINYLPMCDYVINVLPETPETIEIFDLHFFSNMKQSAIFCNVGRASGVIDKDLETAIEKGIIKGAVLDAASTYPYHHPNIILTNHSSSLSVQNSTRIDALFSSQLKAFLSEGIDKLENKIPLK